MNTIFYLLFNIIEYIINFSIKLFYLNDIKEIINIIDITLIINVKINNLYFRKLL